MSMLILAMDQSTECGSLALLRDEHLLGEVKWMESRRHNPQLFGKLAELLCQMSVTLIQVECLAVGLGPGSYTGLRMAISTALGLALPDRRRVYGVSSAEALAGSFLSDSSVSSVMVVGDARRNQCWARVYTLQAGLCTAVGPWLLKPPQALTDIQAAACLTPDWDRIGDVLKLQVVPGRQLITERQIPSACSVGQAVFRRIRAAIPSEPLAPIYLHPAVASPRATGDQQAGV